MAGPNTTFFPAMAVATEAVVKVVAKAGVGTVEVRDEVMVAVAKPEVKVGVARVSAMEEEARWRQWR